jgi:hypothetical protein
MLNTYVFTTPNRADFSALFIIVSCLLRKVKFSNKLFSQEQLKLRAVFDAVSGIDNTKCVKLETMSSELPVIIRTHKTVYLIKASAVAEIIDFTYAR